MKLFLIITSSLLVTSLIIVVAVFWYLSNGLSSSQTVTTVGVESAGVAEGVPLRDLPLDDSQKSALEKVGVDVDTFVITSTMQDCAAEKLGADRMDEIIAGSVPGPIETARLLPCIQ